MKWSPIRVGAICAAIFLLAAIGIHGLQRQQEWKHGGDNIHFGISTRLSTPDTFAADLADLGAPADRARQAGLLSGKSLVARVTWKGFAGPSGRVHLIGLQNILGPGDVLRGAWFDPASFSGASGGWDGRFEELADHYEWLAGVSHTRYTDSAGMTRFPGSSISSPASQSGGMTAWFDIPEPACESFDEPEDVLVAAVFTDVEGDIRWAKPIWGRDHERLMR